MAFKIMSVVQAMKRLEKPIGPVRVEACTVVDNLDFDGIVQNIGFNHNRRQFPDLAEFQSIRKQVDKHLLQQRFITFNVGQFGNAPVSQSQAFGRFHHGSGFFHHFIQHHLVELQFA